MGGGGEKGGAGKRRKREKREIAESRSTIRSEERRVGKECQ